MKDPKFLFFKNRIERVTDITYFDFSNIFLIEFCLKRTKCAYLKRYIYSNKYEISLNKIIKGSIKFGLDIINFTSWFILSLNLLKFRIIFCIKKYKIGD